LHFAGLQGQPRKYAAFPVKYSLWQAWRTLGSIINTQALNLFVYRMYETLLSFRPVLWTITGYILNSVVHRSISCSFFVVRKIWRSRRRPVSENLNTYLKKFFFNCF
jgi:heme/copper-type cytochrome/quinol oxidase subunit 1